MGTVHKGVNSLCPLQQISSVLYKHTEFQVSLQGLVERDRLAFMDILPEDLREDVQKAFQLKQARKWGGNAQLEGLAALEAMPNPEQMAPFQGLAFGEKVRLLSAMTPAQISAILGEHTSSTALIHHE